MNILKNSSKFIQKFSKKVPKTRLELKTCHYIESAYIDYLVTVTDVD